jgi:FtsP/CotA-like multicopper oxidase with cupredoxin domain
LSKAFVFCVLLALSTSVFAETRVYQLFINRGIYTAVNQATFPAIALNESQSYSAHNAVIRVAPGDTLRLIIFNNDSATYGFTAKGLYDLVLSISPGTSGQIEVPITSEGMFLYKDAFDQRTSAYLGFAGMIIATASSHKTYYWNIHEYQASWNDSLAQGGQVDWNTYEPDYFTINGKSYPDIQNDSTAKVSASVGDTVLICIANTGQSMHSIHFHGFHATTLQASDPSITVGWEKDTWAFRRMTGAILRLVVDKPGLYSVHDHNLVAVSGGGTHPNGMFMIMEMK